MRRVLLTGATGFVGRHILRELQSNGAEVSIVARRERPVPDANIALHQSKDMFAEGHDFWARACEGVDTLIHSAWYAEPGRYVHSPANLTCVSGTLRMAEVAASSGVKRIVGLGSCFEYDLSAGYLRTSTPLVPGNPYGASKAATYLALSQTLPLFGVSFAWCRLFYLYGEGEDARRLVPYLRRCLEEGIPAELTSGHQIRDYLDVREAARRIVEIALSPQEGAVNLCSGIPISVRQLALQIADEYGRADLLRFGARPDDPHDPPCVIGEPSDLPNHAEGRTP